MGATVDSMGAQWVYMVLFNMTSIIFFSLRKIDLSNLNFKIFVPFMGVIIFSILSLIPAINKSETFIELARLLTLLISMFIIVIIIKNIGVEYVFYFLFASLFFELIINNLQYFYENNLLGISANKNINAILLLIKAPILFYLAEKFKNLYLTTFLTLMSFLILFYVIIIESRTALLSASIIYLIYFARTIFYEKFKVFKHHGFYLVIFSIACAILYSENQQKYESYSESLNKTINYNETQSALARLDYYKEAYQGFLDKPILGHGLGNWKIISIKYNNSKLKSYIVPYHVHNDFIQFFVEIGFFGGALYFLYIFLFIYKSFKYSLTNKSKSFHFFILLSLICYFFDASLNFPQARPVIQICFVVLISPFFLKQDR